MLRKTIVVSMIFSLVLLSSSCWAEEKPFGDVTTTQQLIDKLFTGRTLDPIEGIWVCDEKYVLAFVKASLIDVQNPKWKNCDYLGIIIKRDYHDFGELFWGLKKTEYPFSLKCVVGIWGNDGYWKLLSQNLLLQNRFDLFVRTYPTP